MAEFIIQSLLPTGKAGKESDPDHAGATTADLNAGARGTQQTGTRRRDDEEPPRPQDRLQERLGNTSSSDSNFGSGSNFSSGSNPGSSSSSSSGRPDLESSEDNWIRGWHEFRRLCEKEPARKLALKEWRNPISVMAKDSVAKVFQVMMDEGIQLTPALSEDGCIHSWVSLLDLARLAVQLMDSFDRRTVTQAKLINADQQFLQARVVDLQLVPDQGRKVADPDCSIWKMFELLRRGPGYASVVDSDTHKLLFMITRSMLVCFLYQTLKALNSPVLKTPCSRFRPYRELVQMFDTESTIDAMRVLSHGDVSGVCLVNAEGELSGMLTLPDLRGLGTQSVRTSHLWEQLKNYKQRVQLDRIQSPAEPVKVPSSSTLGEILETLIEKQVHRVVVTSSSNKPIDMIEFDDIVKYAYTCGMTPAVSSEA